MDESVAIAIGVTFLFIVPKLAYISAVFAREGLIRRATVGPGRIVTGRAAQVWGAFYALQCLFGAASWLLLLREVIVFDWSADLSMLAQPLRSLEAGGFLVATGVGALALATLLSRLPLTAHALTHQFRRLYHRFTVSISATLILMGLPFLIGLPLLVPLCVLVAAAYLTPLASPGFIAEMARERAARAA